METVGILHPGEMGVSLGASIQTADRPVYWASEGRSPQTRQRAATHGLVDAGSLDALCRQCSILISVCPPDAAEDLAAQVLARAFQGLYVDVNAISPQRARRMSERLAEREIGFVDGGIIGGPAWTPGETWLLLSGGQAERAAALFADGLVQTEVLGGRIGQASAVKMCYAAYTKGTTALLCAILGAAEGLGVRADLERQWSRDESKLADQAAQRARRVTRKAWRFAGEMDEIAATFAGAGMPDGFHLAAAEIYRRLAEFKDREETPALAEVLRALASATDEHAAS